MLNAPHVLETALLLLAAFLVGASLGYVARLIAARLTRRVAPRVAVAVPAGPVGVSLVSAPVIDPLSRPEIGVAPAEVPVPDFTAATLELVHALDLPPGSIGPMPAILRMPTIAPLPQFETSGPAPTPQPIMPARAAGEATSGRHVATPHPSEAPAAAPEDLAPVLVAEILQFPAPISVSVKLVDTDMAIGPAEPGPEPAPPLDEPGLEVPPPLVAQAGSIASIPLPAGAAEPTESSIAVDEVAADLEVAFVPAASTATAPEDVSAAVEPIELPPITAESSTEPVADVVEQVVDQTLIETSDPSPAGVAREAGIGEPEQPLSAGLPGEGAVTPTVMSVEQPSGVSVDEQSSVDPEVPASEPPSVLQAPPVLQGPVNEEDDERAAMRAIEGSWTPRGGPPRAQRAAESDAGREVSAAEAVAASGAAVAAAERATQAVIAESVAEQTPELPGRPVGLEAPRDGVKDDLTHIIGVLPIIETALNSLGVFHFDQVAAWDATQIHWVEQHLGIAGRIGREHWREQARELGHIVSSRQAAEA